MNKKPVPIRFVDDYDVEGGQLGDATWLASGGEGITNSLTGEPVLRKEHSALAFRCPGCNRPSAITVGIEKESNKHQWKWDGNIEKPTLQPSINCVGCCGWHGYLIAGVFKHV